MDNASSLHAFHQRELYSAVCDFAASAGSFATTITRYTGDNERVAKVPPNLRRLADQLTLLRRGVLDIPDRFRTHGAVVPDNVREAFIARLGELKTQCYALYWLFREEEVLADDPESVSAEKALEALTRRADHDRVIEFAKGLHRNEALFQMALVLVKGQINGNDATDTKEIGQPTTVYDLQRAISRHEIPYYIERGDMLDRIDDALATVPADAKTSPKIIALTGQAGSGKTQLALQYVIRQEYAAKYARIFWVDAESISLLRNSFAAISAALSPSRIFLDHDAPAAYAKSALESWTVPWLLVFDGYTGSDAFNILDFIPTSKHGHCIITSRKAETLGSAELVSVPLMTLEQGSKLLLEGAILAEDEEETAETDARSIVHALGRLPLAIAQANAYMREKYGTLRLGFFLSKYQQAVADGLPSGMHDLLTAKDSGFWKSNALFTMVDLTIPLLEQSPNGALKTKFLLLVAYFSPREISEEIFGHFYNLAKKVDGVPDWMTLFIDTNGAWSHKAFKDIVDELARLALIQNFAAQDNTCVLSLHPIVRDVILCRLEPATKEVAYHDAALVLAASLFSYFETTPELDDCGFRLSPEDRMVYAAHVATWYTRFHEFKRKHPSVLAHPDQDDMCVYVERLFADMYTENREFGPARTLYQYLWDAPAVEGLRAEDERADAGRSIADLNILEGNLDKAIEHYRGILKYWQKHNGSKKIIRDALYGLSQVLSDHSSSEYNREAITILRDLLQQQDITQANRHDFMAELSQVPELDRLSGVVAVDGVDTRENERLAAAVYSESEALGGITYRAKHWSLRPWAAIINMHPDMEVRESLARECVATVGARRYGNHPSWFLFARLTLADVLRQRQKYALALPIYDCVRDITTVATWESSVYFWAFGSLQEMLEEQGLHEDIIERAVEFLGHWDWCPMSDPRRVKATSIATSWLSPSNRELKRWPEEDCVISLMILSALNHSWDDEEREGFIKEVLADASRAMTIDAEERSGWRECLRRGTEYLDPLLHLYEEKARRLAGVGRISAEGSGSDASHQSMAWLGTKIQSASAFTYAVRKAMCMMHLTGLDESLRYFQSVMDEFAALDGMDEDASTFLAWCLSYWNWARVNSLGMDPVRATEGIQWVCVQARCQLGNREATREWFRAEVKKYKDFKTCYPRGEQWFEGLYGEEAQAGSGIEVKAFDQGEAGKNADGDEKAAEQQQPEVEDEAESLEEDGVLVSAEEAMP